MSDNATAPAPDIDDSLPNGAEVVNDASTIDALLQRFGIGPELNEEPAHEQLTPEAPVTQAANAAAITPEAPVAEQQLRPTEPAAATAPAGFTPEQEAEIAARIEAKAKEFEPLQQEREALQAQLEEASQKLAAQTNPAALPREIDPLLLEDDFNKLARLEADAEQILAWCDEHLDTGYTPEKDGETAFTPAEVRKLRRETEARANKILPKARELAQARAAKRTEVRKIYPELFDGKSEAHQIRLGMYQKAPWLKAVFPQFDLWLGHMLAGEKIYHGRTKAGGASALPTAPVSAAALPSAATSAAPPKPTTPPALPTPGGAPLSTSTAGRKAAARGIDSNEFIARGATRNALVDLIREGGLA